MVAVQGVVREVLGVFLRVRVLAASEALRFVVVVVVVVVVGESVCPSVASTLGEGVQRLPVPPPPLLLFGMVVFVAVVVDETWAPCPGKRGGG